MKTTRKLKTVIAAMLTLAIALTNATLDNITAEAKIVTYQKDRTGMEDARELNGTTVTMKVGDTKKIDMTDTYGSNNQRTYDVTRNFAWASSNETVVSMQRMWDESVGETLKVSHVIIKAEKPGTATITATSITNRTVSFTVNVKAPKVTAKQKKCKHSWKTTKKATCLESGMKTCKKCKLQKVTAKKQHTFKTTQEERYDYTYYVIYQCGACLCEDPSVHYNDEFLCENWCEEEFSTLDYGTPEAALAACNKHKEECNHGTGKTKYIQVPYEQITTYKDVTICTSCGYSEKELDLIFKVNDPCEEIPIKDM